MLSTLKCAHWLRGGGATLLVADIHLGYSSTLPGTRHQRPDSADRRRAAPPRRVHRALRPAPHHHPRRSAPRPRRLNNELSGVCRMETHVRGGCPGDHRQPRSRHRSPRTDLATRVARLTPQRGPVLLQALRRARAAELCLVWSRASRNTRGLSCGWAAAPVLRADGIPRDSPRVQQSGGGHVQRHPRQRLLYAVGPEAVFAVRGRDRSGL